MPDHAAQEFSAIKAIHDALAPLEDLGRARVLAYVASLLGIDARIAGGKSPAKAANHEEGGAETVEPAEKGQTTFANFAELYDAANPQTNGEKALVVGYWLQVCGNQETFTAAAANKELNNLGHKVANITAAIDDLKSQKPALALQLKKSGNTQQARKTYKISVAGEKRVIEMVGG